MSILKKEYELSVWTEELDSSGKQIEKKGMIIGAHDMTYEGRATGVKLKREIKGTNTLTFQMPSKFYDNEKGEFVKNEFTDYLFNEAKIKLKYLNQWFEFYIKKITEDKRYKAIIYNYECEDSFINELSRTGYEIGFQEEYYNNVDELGNFMEITLEDSIWDYRPDYNNGDFTEYSEQRFYKIPLKLLGGKIKAHPIVLDVEDNDITNNEWGKDEEGKAKPWVDKNYKRTILKNIYTNEERKLQYGDDLAREQRLFYDPYTGEGETKTDNGRAFLNSEEIEINDSYGYIYVPYTDLSYVYGNFIANSYKSTSKPAYYGNYEDNKNNKKKKYALQPASTNPYDLIQFIYFTDEDEIKIDEAGTIANMDCHYVIKIEDWNNAVIKALKDIKESLLYWEVDTSSFTSEDSKDFFSGTYNYSNDGDIYYTKDVMPETSLTDDYNWIPVYSDGILDRMGDEDVYAARKISITDRTEYNKKYESYVTVYNNKSSDYNGLYSEKDFNENNNDKGYRVCSAQDTRIIVPTLAKNLIQNGTTITDENGWESKTQQSTTEYNMASYENLLSIEARNISNLGLTDEEVIEKETTGSEQDESVSDFYLQITSPYISRCTDLSLEGTTTSDYVLNFGLSSQEKKIEKDKVYGIRFITLDENSDNKDDKNINEKLTDVVIGQGSCDLDGNYTIAENMNNKNCINFQEINSKINQFLPDGHSISGANVFTEAYHKYSKPSTGLGNWSWSANNNDAISDSPVLLFKSPYEITNPYVGIKVESNPMELTYENPQIDTVALNDGKGLLIAVRGEKEGGCKYLDGVTIGINPFTENYYEEDWINKANAYRDTMSDSGNLTGTIKAEDNFNEAQKLRTSYSFKAKSSSTNRILFTGAQLADADSDDKSAVYALYLDDVFYGLFWFTRNEKQDAAIENIDTQSLTNNSKDESVVQTSVIRKTYKLAQNFSSRAIGRAVTGVKPLFRIYASSGQVRMSFPSNLSWNPSKKIWTSSKEIPRWPDISNASSPKGFVTAKFINNNSWRSTNYGFEDNKLQYTNDTQKLFINANRFNTLTKAQDQKVVVSQSDSKTTIFSKAFLNSNQKQQQKVYQNDYFWFTGKGEQECFGKLPGPLYNYYYYNLAIQKNNADRANWGEKHGALVWTRFDNNSITTYLNPSVLANNMKKGLENEKPTTNKEGFYWGLGYFQSNGKPKVGNYYLIIRSISSSDENGAIYGTELCAEGNASGIITSFQKHLGNKVSEKNCYLISLESTNRQVTGEIINAPYYRVIENQILDSLDLDTLKELIGENSSGSGDGWNSGGTSDSNRGDPYVPPARDDQSIVTPDYIVNYNLYDLHFRQAQKSIVPNLSSSYISKDDCLICLNLISSYSENEGITDSDVSWLMTSIKTESVTADKIFSKLDSLLANNRYIFAPNSLPNGDNKDTYTLKIRPLIIPLLYFNELQKKAEKNNTSLKYSDCSSLAQTTFTQFFINMDTQGRKNYKLAFFRLNNGQYVYDSSIGFDSFLADLNSVIGRFENVSLKLDLLLTQKPTYLNIYSFELFEAYTRGRDFVEYDYTTLRPEEQAYITGETNQHREWIKDTNYFSYKYSGREFDLTNYRGTNNPYKLGNTDIKLGLVHSKDILLETDVTLGDSYTYNRYFIEAIKYKENDKYKYKDTFMVKDYVEAIDATKYIEEDLEILTGNIDLLQCKYYYPQDANSENHWCDCRFGGEGNKANRECLYQKEGICPYRFQSEKHPRRIRTLSVEKSNRFNIIQELSKVFEIYPQFYIEHDDKGKIILDENGRMKKHVFFITEKGKTNKFGFRYEKNLNSISRTVDSSAITTRLFVESIDSELSPTGLCSIESAEDNLGKNSYILNFSYYTMKNILDKEQVERDLYGIDMKTDLAFLPTIGYYNTKYDDLSDLITNMTGESMTNLQAQNITYIEGITTALEERQKKARTMYQFKIKSIQNGDTDYTTSDTYISYLTKYKEYATIMWSNLENLLVSKNLFQYNGKIINLDTDNLLSIFGKTDIPDINTVWNKLKNKYCTGELLWRFLLEGFDEDDIKQTPELESYTPPYESWQYFRENVIDKNLYTTCGTLGQYKAMYDQVKVWRQTRAKYLNKINDLTSTFYKKYEPFIKEGTWTDSNYLTDNEYYWAAESVLADSCKPQISYSISVVDLSALTEYSDDYEFELADTTFIEDIDFFGINVKTGLPNRQKVLISEIDYDLDIPMQNSIVVQNYTTQFDDLFEQISASVQSLTFNENTYKRASNFTSTHIIESDSLQGALDGDDFTLVNSNNDNVVIDENGASGKNINNMASQYKLNGEGLFFSKDGGQTWDIGVGPSGINADYIKAGQLDAGKVQIMDSGYIYFLWDKYGITAYRNPATSTSGLVDFTRFNKYGLSLIENNNIRLRAGYEFRTSTQDKDSYNTTGNYNDEAELSNQNVGFYLYNDSGIPIFKTETRSSFNDDTTDYSARLSMTGEMFITNDVLAGEDDGSAIYQKIVYKATGAYIINNVYANKMEKQEKDSTVATEWNTMGLEYALLYYSNKPTIPDIDVEQKYIEIYTVNDKNYYIAKKNSEYLIEEIDGKKYLKIYDLLNEQLSQQSEAYYLYNNNLYIYEPASINSPISLWRQNRLYAYIELPEDLKDADHDTIKTNYIENDKLFKKDLENASFQTSYVLYQQIKDELTNYYESKSASTINVMTISEEKATAKISANSAEKTTMEYYDCSTATSYPVKQESSSFYKINGVYNTITFNYWKTVEATDEVETTDTTGIKTQTVGIFINNKKVGTAASGDIEQLADGDTSIEHISSVIGGGSERVFTICLKGENTEKNSIVYKNVISVLKNGCAYLGGEIRNKNKSLLDIENMDYLPDEISIIEPSMVVANNGVIISDWEMMYDFTKDSNGHINGITTQSLGELLDKMDSNISSGGGSSSDSGVSQSGYYIVDPLG